MGGTRAFASGLLLLPAADKLVVSYGYADVEARAFAMKISVFNETMWDWCAYNTSSAPVEAWG